MSNPSTRTRLPPENELEALMGLLVLERVDDIIARRQRVDAHYRDGLAAIPGLRLPPRQPENVRFNHGYFPIEVDAAVFGLGPEALAARLREYNVHSRRYFHPLVPDFDCYRGLPLRHPLPTARRVGRQILCLPIYDTLEVDDVNRICEMIRHFGPAT